MEFGCLPPEINSGRMYSGPGSGPLLAAAGAWDGLAAELSSTAASYESTLSLLATEWHGPSSATMAAAAEPYVSWMSTTAAQAEQAANQARAAAAAYEAAFTGTVPPAVIAANRSLLLSLIATNILGQNTPAIAATEAHYAEMWAQDAVVMYLYAAASAIATRLTPFTEPPPTTNLASPAAAITNAVGSHATTSLAQLMPVAPQALSLAAAPAQATGPLFSLLDFLAGPLSPVSLFAIGGVPYLLAMQCVLLPMNGSNVLAASARAESLGVPPLPPALNAAELGPRVVSAGAGNAGLVGRLSVPQGWAAATPAIRSVAAALPTTGPAVVAAAEGESGLLGNLALGGLAGRAIGATGGVASRAAGTGAGATSKPTTATIIVIPPSAEDD